MTLIISARLHRYSCSHIEASGSAEMRRTEERIREGSEITTGIIKNPRKAVNYYLLILSHVQTGSFWLLVTLGISSKTRPAD